MILVNTDYITGKNFEMLGLVKGSTIQSKNVGKDITQGFKTLVGGELKAFNEIINIRYASSAVMAGAAEVMAYGTAVKFTEP